MESQGCRFGPESSRQTLVSPTVYIQLDIICCGLFPKKSFLGTNLQSNLAKWNNISHQPRFPSKIYSRGPISLPKSYRNWVIFGLGIQRGFQVVPGSNSDPKLTSLFKHQTRLPNPPVKLLTSSLHPENGGHWKMRVGTFGVLLAPGRCYC